MRPKCPVNEGRRWRKMEEVGRRFEENVRRWKEMEEVGRRWNEMEKAQKRKKVKRKTR